MTDTTKRRARRTIAEQRAEHEARIDRLESAVKIAKLDYSEWERALREKHETALAELNHEK